MKLEDLYNRVLNKVKKKSDFLSWAPDAKTWVSKRFANEAKAIRGFEELKKQKILASDWTTEIFFKKFLCGRTDFSWVKSSDFCTGKIDEFVGEYETDKTPKINFKVTKSGSEYEVTVKGATVKLKNKQGDKFEAGNAVASGTIEFSRNSNNEVIGGKISVSGVGQSLDDTFKKISGGSQPQPEKTESKFDFSEYECINKWNEYWGYYKLLGGWDGKTNFAYESTSHKVDGRKIKLVYYPDKTVVMRFKDNDQDVPGGKGTWACSTTGTGYTIEWEDGKRAVFGKEQGEAEIGSVAVTGDDKTQKTDKSNTQSTTDTKKEKLQSFKEVCKSKLPCPSYFDFINKNKPYKICMACPEIEEFQKNPVLKVIYFRKLKENGFPEKTDGVFGPITKSAVEEYQEMNGLKKDGIIGPQTYAALQKDKSGRGE